MKRFLRLYRYAKTSGLAKKRSPLSLAWFWCRKGQDFMSMANIPDPISSLTIDELLERRKLCSDWIAGDENDGRLTTDSSYTLDYMCDTIEDIDKEMATRVPLQ